MEQKKVLVFIQEVLQNLPEDWIFLTTHRLDIYTESLAKTQFLQQFEKLYDNNDTNKLSLNQLPTAFDYIRLGHPLSSVLEWTIGQLNGFRSQNVISFSSNTMPIMAVLRKNLLDKRATRILYKDEMPAGFDPQTLKQVYGYDFELMKINSTEKITEFPGSTVLVTTVKKGDEEGANLKQLQIPENVDFLLVSYKKLGSILILPERNDKRPVSINTENYISDIQHVRRRETIAMTPSNALSALFHLLGEPLPKSDDEKRAQYKAQVLGAIKDITDSETPALLASSGLSMQYAIMMGLIDHATQVYPGKEIRIIVPPNCYGGTNDQARRVAACVDNVKVLDLPVDGENDMVRSTDRVLDRVAQEGAVPLIIAEIPTNPRVEVPDLQKLSDVLSKQRKTREGEEAIAPVFILDQTFCPNVQFLRRNGIFSPVQTISYVSGSKFPSGGRCTAGYCVSNPMASGLMPNIEKHLKLCDNEATDLQIQILSEQLPSMNQRIMKAYKNTREFVDFIKKTLPSAKINFVSEKLAEQGFTPSVFSLDLPTKGVTEEERESRKRMLNERLINMMIGMIPNESKYCVSYGQLKGCYWTIPATSTQGTTKESDKDYIARVSLSPELDLEMHKRVFADFAKQIDSV
ncbi:MAG: cystathionine beta-synthase [Brumimicrobium sp.]|nr:cystathionine beta-synthase [Brumimicrobium sp.]